MSPRARAAKAIAGVAADTAYTAMLRIRRVEETISDLSGAGEFASSAHLSIGQEAVAVGVCSEVRPGDLVFSTHRGHGHFLASGGDLVGLFGEMYGNERGSALGLGGSMHLVAPENGFIACDAIVGGNLPIATGAAYALRNRGAENCAVAFFGEGAANQGTFHESLNLASLWELPVIFVCENNLYAEMTHIDLHTRARSVAERAKAYKMPSERVDGNDVHRVGAAMRRARQRALAGKGPTLIECETYRWRGHYEGDPQSYRTKEELAEWKERDPLDRVAGELRSAGTDDRWFSDAESATGREIMSALTEAKSAEAFGGRLIDLVYADRKAALLR